MAIDESGLSKRLPMNPLGSWLYQTDIHGHPIVGDLLFFKNVMTSDGPSYDSLNVTEVLKLETLFDKVIGDLKEGCRMRFFKKGELLDQKIIDTLHQAAFDWENGEIAEVKDTLLDILAAIREFERKVEKQNGYH